VLKPLGAQTIVPGHGGVTGPGLIDDVLGYLRFVLDTAARRQGAGLSPLAPPGRSTSVVTPTCSTPSGSYGNLHRAYASWTAPARRPDRHRRRAQRHGRLTTGQATDLLP